jgi:hypothetical protein
MDDVNVVYDKLRNLYSKETSLDSLTKGEAIEGLVRKLLSEIVEPFLEDENVAIFNRRFDGRISLGRGKEIIFEIKLGYLPGFELLKISNYFYNLDTQFKKPMFLFIAYGLSDSGIDVLKKLREKRFPLSFIDFENLIELHKFVRYNIIAPDSHVLKIRKKFFLEALLENNILTEPSFKKANSMATNRFEDSQSTKIVCSKASYDNNSYFKEHYDERLDKLEYLARSLLDEIRNLKEQSEIEKNRKTSER